MKLAGHLFLTGVPRLSLAAGVRLPRRPSVMLF
jgi:hypothetical protein